MELNPKQRAQLKSLAHHLKPILHIGKEGVGDTAIQAVREALNTRELLKVKVQESSPMPARDAGALLAERIEGAAHVQTIGRTVVMYRPHPESPQIELVR